MLFHMLSRLGSICRRPDAGHAILNVVTPWQYLPTLGMLYVVTLWQYLPTLGMLFCILSRLGSICRRWACCSICCHTLAVSADAWHAILYVATPWQYLPTLGMLFYMLSGLDSICRRWACYSISYHTFAVSAEGLTSKTQATNLKSKLKEQSQAPKT